MLNFDELFTPLQEIEGFNALRQWLEAKTDYFKAPASTHYHCDFEGGLVLHSMNVCNKLCELSTCNGLSWERPQSPAIIGLFHDICKTNFYIVEMRNKKVDGVWEQVPFYTVDEKLPLGHGEKSIILLQRFVHLTQEEVLCIRWHMGAFEPAESYNGLRKAEEICPNVLWTHTADMLASLSEETR